ncbi:MAG: hypothetical protein F6K39_15915 [Okeania sp. SIO3B3]|nr:hypothetical protein [Okeania sp. SIO3B3]
MATGKMFHPINTSIYTHAEAIAIFTTKEKSSSCGATRKTARYLAVASPKKL